MSEALIFILMMGMAILGHETRPEVPLVKPTPTPVISPTPPEVNF